MEWKDEQLEILIRGNPGDFALYVIDGGKLAKVFIAPGLPELSGMGEAEYTALTGADAAGIILPCDRPRVAETLGRLLAGSGDEELTYRILHARQGFVWVHAKARVLGTRDGLPLVMVSFTATSSEAEEQTRLLDYTATIIYVVDRQTHELLFANDEALRLWGRSDFPGQTCYRFINGLDVPCPWCSLPQMQNGACSQAAAYAPQQDMWFDIHCRQLDWHGRDAAAVYAHDVTEQQRRQRSLELSWQQLEAILGNIPGGVAIFSDRDGSIRLDYTNDGFYAVHHGSRAFWDGHSADPVDWLRESDRAAFEDEFRAVRSGEKKEGSATYRVDGEDGAPHWINNQFRRAYSKNGVQYYYSSFVCLDQQRAAEAARGEARRMYEAAVEDAKLVVWEYDIPARRIVMAENEFTQYDYRKFGLPKTVENAPQSLVPYIDEDSVADFLQLYRDVEAGVPRASCEVWYKLSPGKEPRCERISYTTQFDAAGKPVKAYGIGQNITVRKLEEENYQRLYRQISNSLTGAIASFQLNLSQNRYVKGYSQYPQVLRQLERGTADEHFAAVADSIFSEKLRREVRERCTCQALIRLYRSGETQLVWEYPTRTAAGDTVWVNAAIFLLQNPYTGDVEAITYAKDVTRQRKDEEILSRLAREGCDFVGILASEAGTLELHDGAWPDGGMAAGDKSDFQTACARAAESCSTEEDRQTLLELPALCAALEQDVQLTASYSCAPSGGGEQLKKQLRLSWLNDEHSEILVIQSDITEAYRKEQRRILQLREAVLEAEQANSAKTEFLSRISHDIRTPISIISSMTRFAQQDLGDAEKLRGDLRKIESSNAFLLSLINDVLDISKIDSGKTELHPEPYVLSDYLSNIRNMFEPLCREKGLAFRIEESGAAAVLVDRTRLNQITLNLLSNAVKYTPPGGTVFFSTASRRLPDGRIACSIRVKDNGIGMSPAFQKTMFEPFTQEYENPGREKASTGTGLGLAIVKKIVDLMGGTIRVESGLGAGTDFAIDFVCGAASGQIAQGGESTPPPPPRRLSGRVLLAEDNPLNTEIARRILQELGLESVHAANGREAVELFAASPPGTYRAILMDIQMPLMNGYEATAAIRALDRPDARSIPILAMTADAFSAAMEHSRSAGMDDYLTKPIDPRRLQAALEACAP
jgi:signal transduction histidine kinase/CheY-like chemotaxis protein